MTTILGDIRASSGVRTRGIRDAIVAAAVAAIVLSACGSSAKSANTANAASNSSASAAAVKSGVAAAKSIVAKFSQPWPKLNPPGPPVNGATLNGKTVYYIPIAYVVPYFHVVDDALSTALGKLGAHVVVCDAASNPSSATQCMQTAANQGAAAVVTDSVPPAFAQTGYSALKSKGIPVVLASLSSDMSVNGTDSMAYMVEKPDTSPTAWGKLTADVIIAASGGKADVLVINVGAGPQIQQAIGGAAPEFKRLCPACKLTVKSVYTTDQRLAEQTVTGALLNDPNIDYVTTISAMAQGVRQGLADANATNKVRFVGITEDANSMNLLKSRSNVYAVIGTSPYYRGWAIADQVVRVVNNQPPVQQYEIPLRVYTQSNVQPLDTTQAGYDSAQWFGGGNFQQMFTSLWGVH